METKPTPAKLHVRYDQFTAQYANQAVIVAAAEEVYLDFSSGIVTDAASGQAMLPIHTRIAMTHGAARRFLQALEQSLSRLPGAPAAPDAAALPRLD